LSGRDTPSTDLHSIVKIVKPLALFADPAAATAPFVLPRIPFKVNRYWTFQTGAGDSPTLRLSSSSSSRWRSTTNSSSYWKGQLQPGFKLPRKADEVSQNGNVKGLVREIREIFESNPKLADTMLKDLESSKTSSTAQTKHQEIRSLIKIYGGENSRYLNYYGPPRTITTLPYHRCSKSSKGWWMAERSILRTRSSSWDYRKYCSRIERTAFIPFFPRPMASSSAEWKSRQPPSQTCSKKGL